MNSKVLYGALLLLSAALPFTSCKKQATAGSTSPAPTSCSSCQVEKAFPEIPGKEVVINYNGQKITLVQKGDKYIMGGDVVLSTKQVALLKTGGGADARTAINSITLTWPNHTVYYTIDPALLNQQRVTDAITHWQTVTNVVFVPRTTQPNYVQFTTGTGCSSYAGMIGGMQPLTLADACATGNAIHEIGHVIGFYHEQSRSDRDNYIFVNFANIDPRYTSQFEKYTDLGWGGLELQGMDFNSVMLYDSYADSYNGQPTMVMRDGSTFTAQRIGLSNGDIDTYNYLYNRPYLALVTANTRIINTTQQRGRMWDVYVKAYTDATKSTPANLTRNLEVHYIVITNGVQSKGYFTFAQGTNSYFLGTGENLTNLVGTKYSITQDFGLTDLIQ